MAPKYRYSWVAGGRSITPGAMARATTSSEMYDSTSVRNCPPYSARAVAESRPQARGPRACGGGGLVCLATFVLFYLMTGFTLSWGTTALGYSRTDF